MPAHNRSMPPNSNEWSRGGVGEWELRATMVEMLSTLSIALLKRFVQQTVAVFDWTRFELKSCAMFQVFIKFC